jgi:hypothetical protein
MFYYFKLHLQMVFCFTSAAALSAQYLMVVINFLLRYIFFPDVGRYAEHVGFVLTVPCYLYCGGAVG